MNASTTILEGPDRKVTPLWVKVLIAGILVLLVGGGLYACSQKEDKKPSAKTPAVPAEVVAKADYDRVVGENARLTEEVKTLKARPITEGLTTEQCTAMATKIVGSSCTAKAPKVASVAPRRQVARQNVEPQPSIRCMSGCPIASAPPPAPAVVMVSPSAPYVSLGKQLDRCIFRVKGEIKAETMLENGATNCPIWRDQMLQKYHQNPNDKIWERVYPNQPPL